MKAFKTELGPNNVQTTLLRQHSGAGRWAINLRNTVSLTGIYARGDRVRPGLAQAVVGEAGILSQMSTSETFV